MITVKEEADSEKKVCAVNAIKAGTEICTFKGSFIDYENTLKLGTKESFALQIENELYILLESPACYFNHSCEPNCGLTPQLSLITLRDIAKNEELRYDYSTTMLEHHWTMHCKCKAATCRVEVTDFDRLPVALQNKYIELNIVQDFIVKQVDANKNLNS